MQNTFFLLVILGCFIGCNSVDTVNPKSSEKNTTISKHPPTQFSDQLRFLRKGCLNFSNLYSSVEQNEPYTDTLSSIEFSWLFSLHQSDSTQFEKASILKPSCKLFENDSIVSVVFTDVDDYTQALHVFNFSKLAFKPVSSFILYSMGGDAEDFWKTDARRVDSLTYILTEIQGHVNDIESADTTYFDYRKVFRVSINYKTGRIKKKLEKVEKNIVEIKGKT